MSFFSGLAEKFDDVVEDIKDGDIQGALDNVSGGVAQEKIDAWALEVKTKAVEETRRVVYEQSHERMLADGPLRSIIEKGINSAHVPMLEKLGPVAERFVRDVVVKKMAQEDGDDSNDSALERWAKTQLDRQQIDDAVRKAALDSFERYLIEHKDFLMKVAVESLLQKVTREDKTVLGTKDKVPYTRPPAAPM